jgi:hypothetical protein
MRAQVEAVSRGKELVGVVDRGSMGRSDISLGEKAWFSVYLRGPLWRTGAAATRGDWSGKSEVDCIREKSSRCQLLVEVLTSGIAVGVLC